MDKKYPVLTETNEILDFLKNHPHTQDWIVRCSKAYMMDVPMMVVSAIKDLMKNTLWPIDNVVTDEEIKENYTSINRGEFTCSGIKHMDRDAVDAATWARNEMIKRGYLSILKNVIKQKKGSELEVGDEWWDGTKICEVTGDLLPYLNKEHIFLVVN